MFGERLNEVRKAKGYTAKQLSEMLGIHIRAYRKYESGDTLPPLPSLVKIADYFGVSTDYLLERDDFIRQSEESVD